MRQGTKHPNTNWVRQWDCVSRTGVASSLHQAPAAVHRLAQRSASASYKKKKLMNGKWFVTVMVGLTTTKADKDFYAFLEDQEKQMGDLMRELGFLK